MSKAPTLRVAQVADDLGRTVHDHYTALESKILPEDGAVVLVVHSPAGNEVERLHRINLDQRHVQRGQHISIRWVAKAKWE